MDSRAVKRWKQPQTIFNASRPKVYRIAPAKQRPVYNWPGDRVKTNFMHHNTNDDFENIWPRPKQKGDANPYKVYCCGINWNCLQKFLTSNHMLIIFVCFHTSLMESMITKWYNLQKLKKCWYIYTQTYLNFFNLINEESHVYLWDRRYTYRSCHVPSLLTPHSEQNLEVSLK